MNLRTDLALERHEIVGSDNISGIELNKYTENGVCVTEIDVTGEEGIRALGKPKGKYITIDVTPFDKSYDVFGPELSLISRNIRKLLPESGAVLVAGLGNSSITSDALGPMTADLIFATRHIKGELAKSAGLGNLRSAACIAPGVLGKTGIETGEIISSLVKSVKPSAVIAIDALAARRLERLGTTVQMASSGVSPGSGVGNARSRLDEKTLGVPVISIGVPTVVDGATLAFDLMENAGLYDIGKTEQVIRELGEGITVAPKEIDLMVERAARLLALSINCALQPDIEPKDILAIVS